MFNIIELLFPVIFILIFIMIIFTLAKGISTWHKNNNSPRLTVSARIVAKRQNTTYHNQPNAGDTSGAYEYGKLTEGDEGKLTFQGTRYLQFNMEN